MEEVIMGRELRRKQAKKEGKSLQKEEHIEKNQLKQLLIITAILVFIIFLSSKVKSSFVIIFLIPLLYLLSLIYRYKLRSRALINNNCYSLSPLAENINSRYQSINFFDKVSPYGYS